MIWLLDLTCAPVRWPVRVVRRRSRPAGGRGDKRRRGMINVDSQTPIVVCLQNRQQYYRFVVDVRRETINNNIIIVYMAWN